IALEVLFGGPLTGASMNPARSLAPAVVSNELAHLWLYLTAPPLGAVVAAVLWKVIHRPEPTEVRP
ncbi:MAG TPA: aquaporin, partial [Gemmata sp.]|nr:aquaporin [Gemmata sp.]